MPYLAMTAAEIKKCQILPPKIAWMACHFSAGNDGIDNLPSALPAGSLIILDDSIPISHHDPEKITQQLHAAVEYFHAGGILLDFQRQDAKSRTLVEKIAGLPHPLAITPTYAEGINCAVFLPPAPPGTPISKHLQQAKGKEIWLELALNAQHISLSKDGCSLSEQAFAQQKGFYHQQLCCHYSTRLNEDKASFTLWRTKEDVLRLSERAKSLGVQRTVGLWQELK